MLSWIIAVTIYFLAMGITLYFNYCCHFNDKYFDVKEDDK